MALNFRTNKYRCLYITFRQYSDTNKSVYQREEDKSKSLSEQDEDKREWRKSWIKREGEWSSKLSLFNEKNPSVHILNALQNLPNLTTQDVKKWWQNAKVIQQIQNQKYLPERIASLGPNLAALHFFLYRSAAIRLRDSPNWIYGLTQRIELPTKFVEGYHVEAVDCTSFHHGGIRYEGLQNLSGLNYLKWLSLKNNLHVDSWCLDRIGGQNGNSLEYLDLTNCKLDTGCVYAIAKMPALKYLVITDPGDDFPVQAALSILENEKPTLLIKAVPESNEKNANLN